MTHETDSLGGAGLGPFWFADSDAPITDHPIYQEYSLKQLYSIDAMTVKQDLSASYASAESAPIISYLRWLIDTLAAMA